MNPNLSTRLPAPLLQRLIDLAPDQTQEESAHRYSDMTALYEDIRIHLEYLLNTRKKGFVLPEHLSELPHSLAFYGIEDYFHHSFGSAHKHALLCQQIQDLVERFEPRLKQIQVSLQKNEDALELSRQLKLRIEGVLDPSLPPFDAIFESCLNTVSPTFHCE